MQYQNGLHITSPPFRCCLDSSSILSHSGTMDKFGDYQKWNSQLRDNFQWVLFLFNMIYLSLMDLTNPTYYPFL